jgi:hypothetical protein
VVRLLDDDRGPVACRLPARHPRQGMSLPASGPPSLLHPYTTLASHLPPSLPCPALQGDRDSEVELDADGLPADWGAGHAGDVIDLISDTSSGSSGLDSGFSSDSDSGLEDPGSTTSSSDDSQGPAGDPGETSTSSSDEEGGDAPGAGDQGFSDDTDSTSSSDASGAP